LLPFYQVFLFFFIAVNDIEVRCVLLAGRHVIVHLKDYALGRHVNGWPQE
jgi:hypothetical protein